MGQVISLNARGLVRSAEIVLWTSTWLPNRIPRNFMYRPFVGGFCAALRFEECTTLPPSNNSDNNSLFRADWHEKHGRRDNIRICRIEKKNVDDVYDRVVKMANEIVVITSKQHISVCHLLPARNPRSRPILAKFVRRETNFRVLTQTKNLKNSFKKLVFMTK